ncbi:MAG TPA: alginate lyase family protein, partial [Verrucomicrobiae bacterium]
ATSAQAGYFSRLQIADVSGNGELEVSGGTLISDGTTQTTIGSSGRTGTLTVDGVGAVVNLGGWMALGQSTAGTGMVYVANGSLTSSRDGTVGGIPTVSLALGNGNSARGIVTMSGGHLATRSGVLLGVPGTTGTGRFEVRGGLTTIGSVSSTSDGFWLQSSGSTLAAYVTNGSLGTIFVERQAGNGGTYGSGNVIFMPGSKLEVGFLGTPAPGSWTLMRWAGTLLTNGISFVAGTDTNWSFRIDNTNGLVLTYGTPVAPVTNSPFIHPGVMHSLVDLDRMRTNVLAGNQPWYMGYTNLLADSHSATGYAMAGPLGTITRDAVVPSLPTQWQDDCGAAYQNALLWYLTGDHAHADRAMEILDAWSSTCTNINGSDARLTAGLQGFKFITAAELIRYTGAGWSQPEINTCSNFIRTVILPVNRMSGGGNWGQIGAISALAAGVFLDDEAVFNEALSCIKYGAPTECDMGMVNYLNPGGWTSESDRDIGHWGLALDDLTEGAATAWCQNVDLWTFLNNRLLTAHEYLAYFNANNNTNSGYAGLTNVLAPYVAGTQCDGLSNGGLITGPGGLASYGLWADFWERAFNTYQNLIGLPAPW